MLSDIQSLLIQRIFLQFNGYRCQTRLQNHVRSLHALRSDALMTFSVEKSCLQEEQGEVSNVPVWPACSWMTWRHRRWCEIPSPNRRSSTVLSGRRRGQGRTQFLHFILEAFYSRSFVISFVWIINIRDDQPIKWGSISHKFRNNRITFICFMKWRQGWKHTYIYIILLSLWSFQAVRKAL